VIRRIPTQHAILNILALLLFYPAELAASAAPELGLAVLADCAVSFPSPAVV